MNEDKKLKYIAESYYNGQITQMERLIREYGIKNFFHNFAYYCESWNMSEVYMKIAKIFFN